MPHEIEISTLDEFPDSVRAYLIDAIGDDEEFRSGIDTAGGLLRSGPAVVVTSERILVVRSGLIDTRGRAVPSEDVEAFRFEQTDDALVRFEVGLRSSEIEVTLRSFPTGFADRLTESFSGVPVQIDLPDHQSERRTDPQAHAEQAVAAADDARETGDIETAITELETAIDRFEGVGDVADTTRSIEERIESLRRIKAIRSGLEEELGEAEQTFRTAVAAHANGKRTLARIRYRQARAGYADAANTAGESPENTLVGGIDVTVGFDGDPPPEQPSALEPASGDTVAGFGSETVPDDIAALRDASIGELARLHRDGSFRGEFGGLLVLLAWWDGEGVRRFEDRSAIELRERLATVGFALCR